MTPEQLWALLFFVGCPLVGWVLAVLWDALVGAVVLGAPDSLEDPGR